MSKYGGHTLRIDRQDSIRSLPETMTMKCRRSSSEELCVLRSVERSARMAERHLPVIAKRFAPQRTTADAEGLTRDPRLGGGAGEPIDKSLLRERFTERMGDSTESALEGADGERMKRITTRTHHRCSCYRHRHRSGSVLSRRLPPYCGPRFRRTPLRCRSFLHRLGTDGVRGGWSGGPCGLRC